MQTVSRAGGRVRHALTGLGGGPGSQHSGSEPPAMGPGRGRSARAGSQANRDSSSTMDCKQSLFLVTEVARELSPLILRSTFLPALKAVLLKQAPLQEASTGVSSSHGR